MTNKISIKSILQSTLRSYRTQVVLFCCAAIYGMLWSAEAVISISMIGLIVISIFEVDYSDYENSKLKLHIRHNISSHLQAKKAWWWITVPFLLVLFSIPYSEDWTYIVERLRIKLPFLLLPFAFAVMPSLGKRELRIIGGFFVVACSIAAVGVLWNYYTHFTEINAQISRGKAIPTPSNHIRFSLSMVLGIFCAAALTLQESFSRRKRWSYFFGFLTIFLFIFLHILSVRSGLLSFYAALGVFLVQYIYRSRRWAVGLVALIFMVAVPYFAVIYVPSFKNKYYYMKHDIYSYLEGKGENFSDSERLFSLSAAKEIFMQNPVIGVGAGDLKKEMYQVYTQKSDADDAKKMPHSQLVTIATGTGLVGLILFLISFFVPLFSGGRYRNYLFTALHVIIFLSFLSENTFENNFGISLWLFALLIGINYLREHSFSADNTLTP